MSVAGLAFLSLFASRQRSRAEIKAPRAALQGPEEGDARCGGDAVPGPLGSIHWDQPKAFRLARSLLPGQREGLQGNKPPHARQKWTPAHKNYPAIHFPLAEALFFFFTF